MRKLTFKLKRFAEEYIKTKGNGGQAALRTYNTKDPETARTIASQNLKKENVKEELDRLLHKDNLALERFTTKLSQIVDINPEKGYSGADVLDAVKTGLKLHGVLTDRKHITSLNVNAELNNMSTHELYQLHKKHSLIVNDILDGEVVD